MNRSRRLAMTAALIAGLGTAAPAGAAVIEVGDVETDSVPSCPASPCQAISRTTGYQIRLGEERNAFSVPQAGRIVAFTISLGAPDEQQVAFFEENLGGAARAGITVLRMKNNRGRVLGRSPFQTLTPYFGTTVQFPLRNAIYARAGDRVALTVPTWAPALALGLGSDSAWRAARPEDDCTDTENQAAQTRVGVTAFFRCVYRTARLAYSATLVTQPEPPEVPEE